MQPEVRVDSCTSPAAAPERILAPCAGQGLTYNLHEASRCAQPWLQPMYQYAFNPSWGQQQAMDQSWQQQRQQHQHQHQHQQHEYEKRLKKLQEAEENLRFKESATNRGYGIGMPLKLWDHSWTETRVC